MAGAAVAPYEAPAVLLSLAPCRPGRLLASLGAKLDRPQTRAGQRDAEGGERRGDAGAARERRGAQRLRRQHLKLTAVAISQRARVRRVRMRMLGICIPWPKTFFKDLLTFGYTLE